MAVTRIKNNQVTDASGANTQLGINANAKIQNFSITSGKLANNLTYGSDLTITGNLTVQGNSTAIDTTITTIEDPIIVLASTQTSGAPAVDIGFMGFRGNQSNIAFVWDESAGSFVTAFTSTAESNTTITITSLANLQVGNLSLTGNILDALNVTGNVTGGNLLTPGLISAAGTITSAANITGGNLLTGGVVSATANVTGGNLLTGGLISATSTITSAANITGGNLLTAGLISATGTITSAANITGGNVLTAGVVSATANVTGGNVLTGGLISATGTITSTANITGGNLLTAGLISATGTITSAANITGGNLLTAGLISATGTITSAANITGGNVLTGGVVSATANVTGGNLVTTGVTQTGTLNTTGNATVGGNLIVQGNITYINIDDLRVEDPIIILGTGPNGAPLTTDDGKDRGVFMEYFTTEVANAFMGYDNSADKMIIASNASIANDVVTVNAFGVLQAGDLSIAGAIATANITGGNLLTGGVVSATANITGGNILTGGQITATANIIGGNLLTAGLISATSTITSAANVIGGNISTGGLVTATGNVTGGNIVTGGLITATANVTGGNLLTGGLITATANITGGNLLTAGLISATSTITSAANVIGGNISTGGLVTATGNVTGGNIVTGGLITATGTITGANLILTSGTIDGPAAGRVTINASDIDTDFAVDGDTLANVFYVDAGTGTASFGSSTQVTNAIVNFAVTNSIKVPVGNTAQRPATGVTGMMRFNTTTNALEIFDNTQYISVGAPVFTVIDDEQFNGDGSTVAFTLGSTQTTNSCIVSINGVVQVPTVAYSVSGTDPTCVLTFTEAPAAGDLIDVRQITTTTSVTSISNSPGNAVIATNATLGIIDITGNVVPTSNITFDLGSANLRWNDLYLAGNSIFLGNTTIKNTSGNTIGFFGPDGTTPATIDAASVDTTTIANGTSSVAVIASGGNIRSNVAGNTIMTVSSVSIASTVAITAPQAGSVIPFYWADQAAFPNAATYHGALAHSHADGQMFFAHANAWVKMVNYVDGNTISLGNIVNFNADGVGNIGAAGDSFNTVFAKATSAQYADLAEKYAADATYAPGTVVMFGGSAEITLCVNDACSRVAGVVSTNPSYRMNDGLVSEHTAMVALTGRVPTQVTGTVRKGDMMVSAGNGTARAEANPQIGTVIGKALADSDGDTVIEVVVGRV